MQREAGGNTKFTALDAARGLAALVVFLDHVTNKLLPSLGAILRNSLAGVLVNGTAAVILFFVLSGFVLSWRPLAQPGLRPIALLVAKRWPRLAGPTTVVALACALVWFLAAANTPTLAQLLTLPRDAAITCFLHGEVPHNPALWTMKWELLGSFLVAAQLTTLRLPLSPPLRAALFALLWLAAAQISPWLVAFPLGVLMALAHRHRGRSLTITGNTAAALTLTGLFLMSWDVRETTGLWAWTGQLPIVPRIWISLLTQCLAACLIIAVLLYHPSTRATLSGRVGRVSGRASFPLYLVHMPILIAILHQARAAGLLANPTLPIHLALTAAVTALSIPAIIALAIFDRWWITQINRAATP
jgi:peptidoglycan/LPS O-acetylase OafA/YrhL